MKKWFVVLVVFAVVGCAVGNQQHEGAVEGLEGQSEREMEMEKADEQGAGAQGDNGVVEETLENIMASTRVIGESYCRCSGGVQHGGDVDACVADINAVLGKNMDCERAVIEKSSDEFHAFSECMFEAANQYATCMKECNATEGAAGFCDTEIGGAMQQCMSMLSSEHFAELDACK